jgi:hypothetical protein
MHKLFAYQMSTIQRMHILSQISYLPFAKFYLEANFEIAHSELFVDISSWTILALLKAIISSEFGNGLI